MLQPNSYNEPPCADPSARQHNAKGYPWLFLNMRGAWGGLIVTLVVMSGSGVFYVWYTRSSRDTEPASPVGLGYAGLGTLFFILAAVFYSIQRRSRKRAIGQLNRALNWHIFFALMGLVALFMHSFGHFNPISGTYALCSMIVLAISGCIGRMLDHFLPRMVASEVDRLLTLQGDDRIEVVSQKLQAIVVHNTQEIGGFKVNASDQSPGSSRSITVHAPIEKKVPFLLNRQSLGTPWDLTYISSEPTQQELDRHAPQYRLVPDKKSAFNRPGVLMPGAEEQMAELQDMQRAMQREQLYRHIIHYWRLLHIVLAFITISLVIWHIIFATSLLFPELFHF